MNPIHSVQSVSWALCFWGLDNVIAPMANVHPSWPKHRNSGSGYILIDVLEGPYEMHIAVGKLGIFHLNAISQCIAYMHTVIHIHTIAIIAHSLLTLSRTL